MPDNLSNMLRFLGSAQQPLLGLGEALLAKYPGRFALKPVQLPKGEHHSSRSRPGLVAGGPAALAAAASSCRRWVTAAVTQPKPCLAGFEPIPATSEAELDAIIARLQAKAPEWAALPPAGRAALLRACLDTTLAVTEEAAAAATDAKVGCAAGRPC